MKTTTERNILEKPILSTGDLASICHVTKHTIISAIERGELKASRTPGGHNRIRRDDAIDFMKRYNVQADSSVKKILIVDDERFVFDIVTQIFIDEPYQIFYADTGYRAGMLAERERPDLILLDILLPDIDGREVCKHIRQEDFAKDCKILAVTSLRNPSDVEDIYEAGIDDYLAKPFGIAVLQEKMESLLFV